MDAANKPAEYVAVRAATEDEINRITNRDPEVVMAEDNLPLPVGLRCGDLSDQEVETLRQLAEDPNPKVGVMDWKPRRVAQRNRHTVAN